MVKELKFLGYSEEEILEMVKECLSIKFEYQKAHIAY